MQQEDKKLIELIEQFPANYWDFKQDDIKEFTHGIHSYPAMMVCPISRNIIRLVNEIRPTHSLLDPFSGSGTVLVEGMLEGIENVAGSDINPLALLLSKVKTTVLNQDTLTKEVEKLLTRIKRQRNILAEELLNVDSHMSDVLQLDITEKKGWGDEADRFLKEYCNAKGLDIFIPKFKNLGYWFKPRVIMELSIIKTEIECVDNPDIQDFMLIAMSETIRFVSNRRNGEFKLFRMTQEKVQSFQPDVYGEFSDILLRNVEKMKDFSEAISNQKSNMKNGTTVSIFNDNACTLNNVPDDTYDLIITSPPYGDSRTTVAYGQYSRLSLQWINLGLSDREIMGIDKSLMGGKNYETDDFRLQSPTLQTSLNRIRDRDAKRANDVYSFYVDLNEAIKTIAKKTQSGGYQFWVVGDRTVKNETLLTDQIIPELASQYGLTLIHTIGRNIPNKSMPSLNSPSNVSGDKGTTMTMEHIVVLRKD